jgi:glycerol-1-phosphate dehydrogenase [NAD(P)+]
MEKLGWHSLGTAFDCECGVRHELPIEACYIGAGAAEHLARFAEERGGRSALVVSDENTRRAGGEQVLAALASVGIELREQVYPGEPFEATEDLAREVEERGSSADFYLAIGAGTLSDLAKSAGSKQGKPVLLYPTAASMNGYTSAIVALKVRGLKATLPCRPAVGVFADPEVVATAPSRMVAAGLADFLSKCSSSADWRVGHRLRGGYYCHRPREFNEGIQERLFEAAPAVGRGEPRAVGLVLEALMLSGFGMVIAGSSAPASGGEHLISHFLDMKHALYHTPNDLHGIQVGVATVYTLGLWERVLALDPARLDVDALVAAQPSEAAIRKLVFEDWGPEVGREVWAQWEQKRLDAPGLRQELRKLQDNFESLRDELRLDLQPAAVIEKAIREAGGPTRPEEMNAPVDEYRKALTHARYLRNRFNVLDLAAELCIT